MFITYNTFLRLLLLLVNIILSEIYILFGILWMWIVFNVANCCIVIVTFWAAVENNLVTYDLILFYQALHILFEEILQQDHLAWHGF